MTPLTTLQVLVDIFLADEQDVPLSTEPLRRLARLVLEEEGLPDDTEVAILFVDDAQMADYNERFMNRQGPTDVLAFPLEDLEPGQVPEVPPGAPVSLGDVVISPQYVVAQAEDRQTTAEDELQLMVTHGLLHLLGYDHQDDDDAERMESRERQLLSKVGVERR